MVDSNALRKIEETDREREKKRKKSEGERDMRNG